MYLNVSQIATAIGRNPFKLPEFIQLEIWSQTDPCGLAEYLLEKEMLLPGDDSSNDIKHQLMIESGAAEIAVETFQTGNIKGAVKRMAEDFQSEFPQHTTQDLKKFKTGAETELTLRHGKYMEEKTIEANEWTPGNNIMQYYEVCTDFKIGGMHDACEGDCVIEIKNRKKLSNVRKWPNDLCQLIGYLLCMDKTKGKIVQVYGDSTFCSDVATINEWGVIDLNKPEWNAEKESIERALHEFKKNTERAIENKILNVDALRNHEDFGPVGTVTNGVIVASKPKYRKMCEKLQLALRRNPDLLQQVPSNSVEQTFLVIDFETTGNDKDSYADHLKPLPRANYPVEVAAKLLTSDGTVKGSKNFLIQGGMRLNPWVLNNCPHLSVDKCSVEGVPFPRVIEELSSMIGENCTIVAHSMQYDWDQVIQKTATELGLQNDSSYLRLAACPRFCTCINASTAPHRTFKGIKYGPKLEKLAQKYQVPYCREQAHCAEYDVDVLCSILPKIIVEAPTLFAQC